MKKTFLLVAACVMSMLASAQILEVQSVQELPGASYAGARIAAVSPQGDYMLMTSQSTNGLKRYDFATGKLTHITDAMGAGFETRISADGKEIAYQESNIGKDNLVRCDIVRHNMVSQERTVVAKDQRKLDKLTVSAAKTEPVLTNEEGKIYLTKNGKKILIAPVGLDHIYFWASVSPDGTKICYYAGERGCFVCDLKGENNQFISKQCTAAQWYDNNTLVSMHTEDDGYRFTSSVVEAFTLDGKRQTLTDKKLMGTFPYVVNGDIVFTTVEGKAYMMAVK